MYDILRPDSDPDQLFPFPQITVSIVSHQQASLVQSLLADIWEFCSEISIDIVLTLNVDEPLTFDIGRYGFPIKVIRNAKPAGFSANHNQAFLHSTGQFFCVMNPDIRLNSNPFNAMIACFQNAHIGLVAPVVVSENGEIEDSVRKFPTPFKIICKAFGGCRVGDYKIKNQLMFPDWAGGMFMLLPRETFNKLGGFDTRYFLYYEDVDLCARLRLAGYEIALCTDAKVIHHAHRSSHRNIKYFRWHLTSMLRFFCSPVYWRVQCRKWF